MTYLIHIWHPDAHKFDTPNDIADVMRDFGRAGAITQEFDDACLMMAEMLMRNFPSPDIIMPHQTTLHDGIFFHDLREEATNLRCGLWTLKVPEGHGLRVMRDVAYQAMAQGLAAFDPQLGMYFHARTGVLPESEIQRWNDLKNSVVDANEDEEDEPEVVINKAYLKKYVVAKVGVMLKAIGFKIVTEHGSSSFRRQLDAGGYQSVSARFFSRLSGVELEMGFAIFLDELKSAGIDIGLDSAPHVAYSNDCSKFTVDDQSESFKVAADFKRFLTAFEEKVIPILQRVKTVEDVNWLLLTEEGKKIIPNDYWLDYTRPDIGFSSRRCMVAGLAKNPDFEKIVKVELDACIHRAGPHDGRIHEKVTQIAQYFRTKNA